MMHVLTAVSLVGAVDAVHLHVAAVVRRDAVRLVPHVLPARQLPRLALRRRWGHHTTINKYGIQSVAGYK